MSVRSPAPAPRIPDPKSVILGARHEDRSQQGAGTDRRDERGHDEGALHWLQPGLLLPPFTTS
jgi:hypothetical protein